MSANRNFVKQFTNSQSPKHMPIPFFFCQRGRSSFKATSNCKDLEMHTRQSMRVASQSGVLGAVLILTCCLALHHDSLLSAVQTIVPFSVFVIPDSTWVST